MSNSKVAAALMLTLLLHVHARLTTATWCVARSDATRDALQMALAGADCAPLQQSGGLCFLPNTIQAHASYAFNSYYMHKFMGPGSCDFSGTATIAKTDPSYGSCVYPPSPSTAGGGITTPPAVIVMPPVGNDTLLDTPSISKASMHPNTISIFIVIVFLFITVS